MVSSGASSEELNVYSSFFNNRLQRFPKSRELLLSSPFFSPFFFSFLFLDPHSWRVSYIIYFFPVDLGHPSVDHAGHYSSARLISYLPKPSVSYGNQDRTI